MAEATTSKFTWFLGVSAFIGALIFAIMLKGNMMVAAILGFLVILFFSYHLEIGLYILIILYPLIGWEFHADIFRGLLGSSSAVLEFYAPMVDVWALLMVGAYLLYLVRKWLYGEKHRIYLPEFGWYSLFIISGLLSLTNVAGWELQPSFSYLVRFLLFVYLAYVVLGANIIRTKKILHRALEVVVWIGVVGAILGLLSFAIGPGRGVMRAVPIPVFGWQPFNYDTASGHILLAEVLVVAFPIAIYLALRAQTDARKIVYTIASAICGITAFLTFSRASWLTLIVQGMLALYIFRSQIKWKKIRGYFFTSLLFLIPAGVYMALLLQSAVVSSSNSTRITLTEVAWSFFLEHPVVGQGVGTFVERLQDIHYFTYEFGDPIDAHSVLMKILAEQGILGVATFGLFIGLLLFSIYKRTIAMEYSVEARGAAQLCLFLIIVPLFFQMFNTQYYSARMWVPFMLAIASHLLYRHEHEGTGFYTHFRPNKYKIDTEVT
ncbi:MAG TPA: O-antigen ligase family protein [Candidatus Magasanikbacteria bacterium]|nr:O-antigen ligase family protein [Candidatus Magasanikbacteria bacterium]